MNDVIVNNNSNKKKNVFIAVIVFLLFIILFPRIMLLFSKTTGRYHPLTKRETPQNIVPITVTPAGPVFPSVSGAALIDSTGQPFILHGAMLESSLAYINRWKKGEDPTEILNGRTFGAMASWHMNAVRINISQWIYELDPTKYMNTLDQIVGQANTAGLYVVLDFHDDKQSGSPYSDGMLHAESIQWWKMTAGHFKDNAMIMFDPINEPKYPDWQTWLHGNAQTVRGIQDIIDAIRSVGAHQIIVLEPGSSGKDGNPQESAWATFDSSKQISDPNILYSIHDYRNVITGNPSLWDHEWGPILNHYPIYYGEWAVLPHADHPEHCQGLDSTNAQGITTAFLQYMKDRNASWTAWDFEPGRLINNYTDFTPTTFNTSFSWQCESITAKNAGMGETVKNFLNSLQ